MQYPGQPQQSAPPQYPGQPFAAPGQPAAPAGSGLGRVAFILSLVALAIGLLVTFALPLIIRSIPEPAAIGLFSAVGNGLVLIVSIAALIVGLMSMRRPRQQILAGIAIGISASAIAGIVISWLSNLAYSLSY